MKNSSMILRLMCLALVLNFLAPNREVYAQDTDSKAAIDNLLTRFRQAAADANGEAYFGCLDPEGVFFGTDENERFTYQSLKKTFMPYFEQGVGWKHQVLKRNIYLGPNNQFGWFDEITHREKVGNLRTTGVVRNTENGWKIVQYNVAFVVPNEVATEVAEIIGNWKKKTVDATSQDLTAEERAAYSESFEYVWTKIRDSYWDKDLGGVNWQSAYDDLKPKLQAAQTKLQAIGVLHELVTRMEVSHFSIIPESAYEALGKTDAVGARNGTTGIDVRIANNQVIVVSVDPDSPAGMAGVRTGWIVKQIGDTVVETKLAEIQKEFEKNPHARVILASAANSRLRGNIGDKLQLTLVDENNTQQEMELELVPRRGEKVQFGHLPEFRVWVDIKSLEGDIAYFRFNAFMNPMQVMSQFNGFMQENMDANGIIIDVRGNGGGSGEIAMGMIGWLMPGEKASFGKVILRDNELNLIVRPRPETYEGHVAVLIDELSVSAAEFFASGIQDLTGARLFGRRTAGAVLGSQIEKLPTGEGFQYAAANFISKRTGKTLEGVGVPPHQKVELNREVLLAGKDPVIEAALEWIHSQNSKPDSTK